MTNRVAQSTDVISATLFLVKTSKGLSRFLHIVILTSFLKIAIKQTSNDLSRVLQIVIKTSSSKIAKKQTSKEGDAETHDRQNKDMEICTNNQGQEKHVCMYGLHHGNPGLRVLFFVGGYGLSNEGVDGHTWKGNFK